MSQIIQMLQTGTDSAKGLLLRQVREKLDQKLQDGDDLSPLETDLWQLITFDALDSMRRADLVKRLSKINLLSEGLTNPKTAKDAGLGVVSNWILHLSPSDLSGVNMCPSASAGCRAACLNGAGRGLFDGVQLPRLRKTLYFIKMRSEFLSHLDTEISRIELKAQDKRVIVRLNGTSDLAWETMSIRDGLSVFELHPKVQFYDYTKRFNRLARLKDVGNYHVTFSASESNHNEARQALAIGINVAMVFAGPELPKSYKGFEVVDGDLHDFRFLDQGRGVIVGLKAKGPAKRDKSGFVRVA